MKITVGFMLPLLMAGKLLLTDGRLPLMVGNVDGKARAITWLTPPTPAKLPKNRITNLFVQFASCGT